jgi:hypothetical protein
LEMDSDILAPALAEQGPESVQSVVFSFQVCFLKILVIPYLS